MILIFVAYVRHTVIAMLSSCETRVVQLRFPVVYLEGKCPWRELKRNLPPYTSWLSKSLTPLTQRTSNTSTNFKMSKVLTPRVPNTSLFCVLVKFLVSGLQRRMESLYCTPNSFAPLATMIGSFAPLRASHWTLRSKDPDTISRLARCQSLLQNHGMETCVSEFPPWNSHSFLPRRLRLVSHS